LPIIDYLYLSSDAKTGRKVQKQRFSREIQIEIINVFFNLMLTVVVTHFCGLVFSRPAATAAKRNRRQHASEEIAGGS
jgi:hypothetical protein